MIENVTMQNSGYLILLILSQEKSYSAKIILNQEMLCQIKYDFTPRIKKISHKKIWKSKGKIVILGIYYNVSEYQFCFSNTE